MTDRAEAPQRKLSGAGLNLRRSCDSCHRGKVKCDGIRPACKRCYRRNGVCVYSYNRPVGRPAQGQGVRPRPSAWFEEAGDADMALLTSVLMPQAPGGLLPEETSIWDQPLASWDALADGGDALSPVPVAEAAATSAGADLDDSLTTAASDERLEIGAVRGATAVPDPGGTGSGLCAEGPMLGLGIEAVDGWPAGLNTWHTTSDAGADHWPDTSGANYIARGRWGAMGDSDCDGTANIQAGTGANIVKDPGHGDWKCGEDMELMCLEWEWVAVGPGMFLVIMPL
ncbi:hypothetical protein CSAL01_11066 [Colletotrichum salicis]|uniref:Zn(2)-C6 fungal-type domain-containing protein n=1 Tax=Colletotrichum salicis TaxID=1209931 RepID=A0A135URT8_9PEZI|nr:hypothetical protein CSAL01_11066 [Colletotrichum salicis]